MYSRVNYTLIGLFVIFFTLGIIFFALWLGNSSFKDDTTPYLLRMKDSVSGLSKDSGVKLKGVDIGTVKDIRVNPNNIEEIDIILNIKKDVPIKEDMRGVISMFGLTGLSYIEIEGGSNGAKRVVSIDGNMPIIKSGSSLITQMKNRLEILSQKLVDLIDSAELVLSDKNIKNFSTLIESANQVATKGVEVEEKISTTLDDTNRAIRTFIIRFEELSKNYNTLALNVNKELKPLVKSFDKSSKSFDKTAKSVEQLAVNFEKTVNRGDYNMQKIMQPSMNDIRELSSQLSSLTRELRQSPSDILYKSRKPRRGPGE